MASLNIFKSSKAHSSSICDETDIECDSMPLLEDANLYDVVEDGSVAKRTESFEICGSDCKNPLLPETKVCKKQIWKARAFIILASILYGTSFPLIEILDENIPVGISLTLRFGLAALVTLPWLLESPSRDWNTSLSACYRGVELGLWDLTGSLSQTIGLYSTQASKSAFLCSLEVVIVPFLDRIIGIPLASVQLIAATMSVSGVGLLSLESGSITITAGDLWSLIQPVAYGISFWRTEHALRRYPDEANRLIASQLMACFIISLVTTTISHETGKDDAWDMRQLAEWLSNPEIVIALLWTGILSTAVTSYLETNAMKHLTATESTLLVSSEPLWASLFAWILVGEKLGVTGVIGGVIIVLSCILSMM